MIIYIINVDNERVMIMGIKILVMWLVNFWIGVFEVWVFFMSLIIWERVVLVLVWVIWKVMVFNLFIVLLIIWELVVLGMGRVLLVIMDLLIDVELVKMVLLVGIFLLGIRSMILLIWMSLVGILCVLVEEFGSLFFVGGLM